jgi:tetratricopeptide (TPR) repeat protein
MALAHAELGHVARARRLATDALRATERLGDARLRAHVLDTLARVELAAAQPETAVDLASQALELARSIGYARVEADASLTRARAHLAAGSPADAEADFSTATDLLRRHGPRSQLRAALREWAAILVDEQRHAEAVTLLSEAATDDPPTSVVRH